MHSVILINGLGPVVCNFLDGLSRVVHKGNGQSASRQNTVQHLTVHQYAQSRSSPDFMTLESTDREALKSDGRRRRESPSEDLPSTRRKNQKVIRDGSEEDNEINFSDQDLRPLDSQGNHLSVFDREYFNDGFYQNLLKLFVKQRR